ncbi:hypothetical protein D9M71_492940 [compost metagenome]
MTTLAELYASGDVEPFHCLSIVNPALADGGFHLVRDWESLTATLETRQEQLFQASWFDLQLPEQGPAGQQQLQFRLSNITGHVRRSIELIRAQGGDKTEIVYRAYVPGSLGAPARLYRMTAVTASTRGAVATINAVYRDPVNDRWPRGLYTQERFPGLRYFNG